MKGSTGITLVLLLIVASLAAGFGVNMVSGQSEDLKDLTNDTAENNSDRIKNVSCQRECISDHPSKGSSYYTCLENKGCS